MANNYCSTETGRDSWDYHIRTPPRPRQDLIFRQRELDELENTQEMLRQIDIDRKTCVGPSTYAGFTPRRLIQRKRSEAEKRKLLEANNSNSQDKPPLKRQKRLKFAGKKKSINFQIKIQLRYIIITTVTLLIQTQEILVLHAWRWYRGKNG